MLSLGDLRRITPESPFELDVVDVGAGRAIGTESSQDGRHLLRQRSQLVLHCCTGKRALDLGQALGALCHALLDPSQAFSGGDQIQPEPDVLLAEPLELRLDAMDGVVGLGREGDALGIQLLLDLPSRLDIPAGQSPDQPFEESSGPAPRTATGGNLRWT